MRAFRAALALGIVLVLVVGAWSAFPLAILLAAVLVPGLTVIYAYDVDVYEDAPVRVTALTAVWGIVAGTALALLVRTMAGSPAEILSRSTTESLLVEGVAIPLVGVVLGVIGPLFLLLDRRFDDVLDGVTFGTTSAVWLAATATMVSSSSLFSEGLRPGGSITGWSLRLLVLAVASPLLWAGFIGAATGSLWLRYRAPVDDHRALGPLGHPVIAFALAASGVVAGAVAQLVLPLAAALITLLVLAGLGLLWLRHCLHVGLLQEADQLEIGEVTPCVNCGNATPRHAFCGYCGVARRALPKPRLRKACPRARSGMGDQPARLRDPLVPAIFAAVLIVAGGATVTAVVLVTPSAEAAICDPGEPCGGPPSVSPVLERGSDWRGSEGIAVAYDEGRWTSSVDGLRQLVLERTGGGSVWLKVSTLRGGDLEPDVTPPELAGKLRAIEPLSIPLHAPSIGYADGVGGWYSGFLDSPQGPRSSATIAALSARRDGVTVYATAIFFYAGDEVFTQEAKRGLRSEVDSILNTVRWGAEPIRTLAVPVLGPSAVAASSSPKALGPTAQQTTIELSVTLAFPDRSGLLGQARAVADPESRWYRRFVTAETAGERFGLGRAEITEVVRRFERSGLDVISRNPQRTALRIRASARDIGRFFKTTLEEFERPDGTHFRRPRRSPRLPDDIAALVDGIVGLDTESAPRARAGLPTDGLRPLDIGRAYEIQPLWDAGARGETQTVAVLSLDSFRHRDIAEYDRLMEIRDGGAVERVQVTGRRVLPGANALEASLDIEVIRAVAPKATIVSYEAPLGWLGFVEALRRINAEGRADIVSVSWGKCVDRVPPEVREAMELENAIAVAAGRTIFAASGDSGAFSCLHSGSELNLDNHARTVDWPASSPNVVAVGGTRLTLRSDGSYFSENGWEEILSNRGTGGGVSRLYDRPRWQRAPGVENRDSSGKRQVPDVSGPADCDSGFLVVYPRQGTHGLEQVTASHGCGTSAAAPFWAGVAALTHQYAAQQGLGPVGFMGPLLYELARGDTPDPAFYDVQTGGNLDRRATRGWDYATGLGSPRVWNLARGLVAVLEQKER